MNIPNLPMQLLAITDSGGANAFFNNDLCQMLITEGNSVADKLRAHFMTSAIGNQLKCKYFDMNSKYHCKNTKLPYKIYCYNSTHSLKCREQISEKKAWI